MRNDKGFSIVLVLLLLGLISILGSALMMMSRSDLNFTGAIKNYDKLFNLADGACGIAFNDISLADRDPDGYTGTAPAKINLSQYNSSEQSIGSYNVVVVLQGFDDSARSQPGWEAGTGSGGDGYQIQDWTGEGHATRFLGSLMVEAAVLKHRRD